MDRKEALSFFKENVEWYENDYYKPNPNNEQVEAYKVAIKALEALETPEEKHGIDWESIEKERILKARKGKYVIYDVDYLLKHLHHEIYIFEHERLERSRREKEGIK